VAEKTGLHQTIRTWAPYVFLAFTAILPTTLVVFFRNNAGAGILAAVGVACLLMLRLDDISEFGGFGVKAKMEKTIRDAEVTLEGLRSLSLALSRPILSEIAMHGQLMSRLSTEYRVSLRSAVIDSLKSLGATDGQIAEADELWRETGTRKLLALIASRLHELSQGPAAAEILEITRADPVSRSVETAEDTLKKHQVDDSALADLLEDLRVMANTGDVRRPGAIPFNLSIGR
jgi:hypothetical protein